MVYNNALDAKVAAVNAVNSYALELFPQLRKILQPFVGQKIMKVNGTLLAKVEKLIPELPKTCGLNVFMNHPDLTLSWTVKGSKSYSGVFSTCQVAMYYEMNVYIGHMSNGVLQSLYPSLVLRTDYTAEEINTLRETYWNAKNVVSNAYSMLYPFGEYDR